MSTEHPTDLELAEWIDAGRDPAIGRHVVGCQSCLTLVAGQGDEAQERLRSAWDARLDDALESFRNPQLERNEAWRYQLNAILDAKGSAAEPGRTEHPR